MKRLMNRMCRLERTSPLRDTPLSTIALPRSQRITLSYNYISPRSQMTTRKLKQQNHGNYGVTRFIEIFCNVHNIVYSLHVCGGRYPYISPGHFARTFPPRTFSPNEKLYIS